MWCCAWQSLILPPKCRKWAKNKVFEIIAKFSHWYFLNLVYKESLYYLLSSCTNSILGKSWFLRYRPKCSRPIRLQDFKSTIFPGQNYEKAKFCACWHRFMIIKRWLKNIGVSMVKNGWGHSSLRTLKLAVSQEGINEINWLFGVSIKIQESQKLL